MRILHADLHIHTCLSPCAEREMSPSRVVRQAREKGLDLIAICDHNSAENVEAASRAAEGIGLAVIGGFIVLFVMDSGRFSFPNNYAILFFCSFGFLCIGFFFFSLIREDCSAFLLIEITFAMSGV